MNSNYTKSPGENFRTSALVFIIFYGLFIVVSLPAVLLALVFKYVKPKIFENQTTSILSGVWLLVSVTVSIALGWYFENILLAWLSTIPSFLFIGFLIRVLAKFIEFLRPKSPQEKLQHSIRLKEQQDAKLVEEARKITQILPGEGQIRLGRVISRIDKNYIDTPSLVSYKDGWLVLDERLLDKHLFVLGATGAGKSESLKRIVFEVLENTNRDVFVIDGKGELAMAKDIRAMAYHKGRGIAPHFIMGHDPTRGAKYDGFRGQPQDIYNRLVALLDLESMEGPARYYADMYRDILQLVCYAPAGSPKSFQELAERINREWLLGQYKNDSANIKAIEDHAKERTGGLRGLGMRIRPIIRDLAPFCSEDGFALEDTRCVIFSLRTSSVGDSARRFFDFFLEDVKDFMGKRQRRPAVLIIDEFGQFPSKSVIPLLSLGRGSRQGVILLNQNVSTLHDYKENILSNTTTQLMMRTDFPEDLALMAGTRQQLESSIQLEEDAETGRQSVRQQHAHKIDMNNPPKLAEGQGYLIRERRAFKIQMDMIPNIPDIPPQEIEKYNQLQEQQKKQLEEKKVQEPKDSGFGLEV